jgi:hypothetical protein
MYSPQATYLSSGIASTFALPVEAQREGKPGVIVEAPKKQTSNIVPHTSVAEEIEDEFDRWANGGDLGDAILNTWRNRVHQSILAGIDWDSEEYLADLKDRFGKRNIYFEGQQTRESPGEVRLQVSRDPKVALVLRFLERGAQAASQTEHDSLLLYAAEILSIWSVQVLDQLRTLRNAAITKPESREVAIQCLVVGAMLRGKINSTSNLASALAQAFQSWPKAFEEMAVDWPESWQKLVKEFQRHVPNVQSWLRRTLACTKGGAADAGILDPSPILNAVERVLRSGEIDDLIDKTKLSIADPSVETLAKELLRRQKQALKDAQSDFQRILTTIDKHLGVDEPGVSVRVIEKSLECAAQHGVLRGSNSIEVLEATKNVGMAVPTKGLQEARQAVIRTPARLDVYGSLPRQELANFADYLRQVDEILDKSLAVATSTDDCEIASSMDTLQKNFRDNLEQIVSDLRSMGAED